MFLASTAILQAQEPPRLRHVSVEFQRLRGLRSAGIEFEGLRGLNYISLEFERLRGIRRAAIEFDLFEEDRQIEVFLDSIDFGIVPVGSTGMQMLTIANSGFADLTVTGLNLTGTAGFSVSSPSIPFVLRKGAMLDLTIDFTPTSSGLFEADLEITSDDEDNPLVSVCLSGAGDAEPSPEEQIEEILAFIDEAVGSGDLSGSGPGNSGPGRLQALINMIEAAGDLIATGDIPSAIEQLEDALNRTDGQHPPPDFVTGLAASQLAALIQALLVDLGR